VTSSEEFDRAIEASHRALDQIARGDPSGFFDLFSSREDATLANPFGPPARGMGQIQEAGRRAASNYRDGRALEFETYAKYVTTDLAYILEVERFEAKVGGNDEMTPIALRTTSVFRPEGGDWKLVHRHADPITTSRPADSVIQTD
jgi:ketosteroid isomerase-like protein